MSDKRLKVLFLCTHNSARSVLAESTANAVHGARLEAFSAGSHPSGRVNPHALALLETMGHDVSSLESKSWDVFAAPGAQRFDVVITVCGDAADEACPVWPGGPVRAHWGLPDPSRCGGDNAQILRAFTLVQRALAERIGKLAELRDDEVTPERLVAIHAESTMPDIEKALQL